MTAGESMTSPSLRDTPHPPSALAIGHTLRKTATDTQTCGCSKPMARDGGMRALDVSPAADAGALTPSASALGATETEPSVTKTAQMPLGPCLEPSAGAEHCATCSLGIKLSNGQNSDHGISDEAASSGSRRNRQAAAPTRAAASDVSKRERYCICRQPYNAKRNGDMIRCDDPGCRYGWFHASCLFLRPSDLQTRKPFICRFCSGTGADLFTSAKCARRPRTGRTRHLVTDYARLHEGDLGGALRGHATATGALVEAARAAAETQARRFASNVDQAMALATTLGIRFCSDGTELVSLPDAPCVVLEPAGLDMRIPASAYSYEQVAHEYGIDRVCEVLDVARQSELEPRWTLGQYLDYLSTEPALRQRVLNLISLEISETLTGRAFQAPGIIRKADWAALCPPPRPHVDTYYLLSATGSWTSWHIDFGGSTVFYHVLEGRKRFYVCPPTERHLQLYERWQRDPAQALHELDFVEQLVPVATIELEAGHTLFIPAGWLHAVFTPTDSIVLGGNILHLSGVAMQQRIYQMERRLRVPPKYQFPLFRELHWLALRQYAETFDQKRCKQEALLADFSEHERRQLRLLVDLLGSHIRDALAMAQSASNKKKRQAMLRDLLGLPSRLALSAVQRYLASVDDALHLCPE